MPGRIGVSTKHVLKAKTRALRPGHASEELCRQTNLGGLSNIEQKRSNSRSSYCACDELFHSHVPVLRLPTHLGKLVRRVMFVVYDFNYWMRNITKRLQLAVNFL